jgi:glycosyltransferase involved in cell wall biosynthesis
MIDGKRICVVMPAYNAEQTLRQTVAEVDRELVDDILLVDDASSDTTVAVAKELQIHHVTHSKTGDMAVTRRLVTPKR